MASEPGRRRGPSVVYTHVPKTAGTTIGYSLKALFGEDRLAIATTDNDDLSAILPRLHSLDAVAGHVRYPVIRPHAPDAAYFAAVRDPIDRIVSNYFFVIRHRGIDPDIYRADLRRGFDVFYERIIRNEGRINLQSRFFADTALARDAAEVIRSAYALVWSSERTSEAWTTMKRIILERMGLDAGTEVPQVDRYVAPRSAHGDADGSRPESYRDFLGPDAVAAILRENAEDLRLFEWVQERGGIVQGPGRLQELTT